MKNLIIGILFLTVSSNTVFAADALVLSDTLKAAFEAKMIAENGMHGIKTEAAKQTEVKGPSCACDTGEMTAETETKSETDKKDTGKNDKTEYDKELHQ